MNKQVKATPALPFGVVNIVLLVMAVLALGMMSYSIYRGSVANEKAGPLSRSAASVKPEKSILCVGDSLVFTVTVTVESAPISTDFVANIWDVSSTKRIQTLDDSENNSIYLPQDIGIPITKTSTITETATLPPGAYEFRRFTQSQGYVPQAYFVPFEVQVCE